MSGYGQRRVALRTLLLVGEGDAEVQFLKRVTKLYVLRGSGVSVTVKNARGKGAAHVVRVAMRHPGEFDAKAALLDTDTDWDEKLSTTARRAKVQVLACEPCFEALLLAVHGHATHGKPTAILKREFEARFGAAATQVSIYHSHFGQVTLQTARARLSTLATLLQLLEQWRA